MRKTIGWVTLKFRPGPPIPYFTAVTATKDGPIIGKCGHQHKNRSAAEACLGKRLKRARAK